MAVACRSRVRRQPYRGPGRHTGNVKLWPELVAADERSAACLHGRLVRESTGDRTVIGQRFFVDRTVKVLERTMSIAAIRQRTSRMSLCQASSLRIIIVKILFILLNINTALVVPDKEPCGVEEFFLFENS